MYKIITISREFGSKGRTIGKKLAEKLGYNFYDSSLVDKIAIESGYHKEFIKEHAEYASSSHPFVFSFYRTNAINGSGTSIYDEIFIAQQKVILDIASKENAVIVGRCADYILRDRNDVFNVFIYSDLEKRKENIINEYGEIENESIDKRIKEKDKRRKLYYKTYTGREFGDVKNYHIALDSSTLGIDTCVDILYSILGD